jgi:hypothetical protein
MLRAPAEAGGHLGRGPGASCAVLPAGVESEDVTEARRGQAMEQEQVSYPVRFSVDYPIGRWIG